MVQTLLITRPMPQALKTQADYRAQGWECILSPAIISAPLPDASAHIAALAQGCDAWVVSSGVALEVLGEYYKEYNHFNSPHLCPSPNERGVYLPLYVTGEVLAAQAYAAGFNKVQHGGGSAEGLLAFMQQSANPAWRYGYLHSNHQSVDVVGRLRAMGWMAQGAEIYHTTPAASLTQQAILALQAGKVDVVSFYSSMTVRAFLHLATQAGVLHSLRHVQAWCYSEQIQRAVSHGIFADTRIIHIASPA